MPIKEDMDLGEIVQELNELTLADTLAQLFRTNPNLGVPLYYQQGQKDRDTRKKELYNELSRIGLEYKSLLETQHKHNVLGGLIIS